jgi:hypothetical protein
MKRLLSMLWLAIYMCSNIWAVSMSLAETQAVSRQILEILDLDYINTPEGIHKALQIYFLRPSHKERWQYKSPYESNQDQLMPLLTKLNVTNPIYPSQNNYHQIIVFGTLASDIHHIANFLKNQLLDGLKAKNIFVLTSDRLLSEAELKFINRFYSHSDFKKIKTEGDAIKIILNHQLNNVINPINTKIVYINTPMIKTSNGNWRRPTTQDTIEKLIKNSEFKMDKMTLLTSHAPFIQYQEAVYRFTLQHFFNSNQFQIDACGPAPIRGDLSVGVLLDTVVRLEDNLYKIYQLNALQ